MSPVAHIKASVGKNDHNKLFPDSLLRSDKKVWSDHDGGGVCDSFSLCVFSLLDVCGSLFTPECVRLGQSGRHKAVITK